ncbi:MAG TPA: phosphosulfolactate synthase [Acidimicrobiales bacterium]|nr:phosphosulfolactate synthase [Acidimicrobiales bacterium]
MSLSLPPRTMKPRTVGLTMVIDTGVPLSHFSDVVESHADHIDFVKFGWGTSVVTTNFHKKLDVVKAANVDFYLGGTLFEKYVLQERFDEFRSLCQAYGCTYVEVSNGTIDMTNDDKADYVKQLSGDFRVISEVGSKNQVKSDTMAPNKWINHIQADIDAGAVLVTLETRESGRGGICRSNGELRYGLIEEILSSKIDHERLLFEAPSTDLQSYFVRRLGPDVNLGNISVNEIIPLETIRLGLRSETLLDFEPGFHDVD